MDVLDPGHERRVASGAVRAGVGERPVKIVDRRQQLECQLDRTALLRGRVLAHRPLAVVLELRPRALCDVEVFVGLLGLLDQADRSTSSSVGAADSRSSTSTGIAGPAQ